MEIRIVYFVPDEKKAGGAYAETVGKIRKIEWGELVLENGRRIPGENVIEVTNQGTVL